MALDAEPIFSIAGVDFRCIQDCDFETPFFFRDLKTDLLIVSGICPPITSALPGVGQVIQKDTFVSVTALVEFVVHEIDVIDHEAIRVMCADNYIECRGQTVPLSALEMNILMLLACHESGQCTLETIQSLSPSIMRDGSLTRNYLSKVRTKIRNFGIWISEESGGFKILDPQKRLRLFVGDDD